LTLPDGLVEGRDMRGGGRAMTEALLIALAAFEVVLGGSALIAFMFDRMGG
jgi:hypothetical protein